MSPSSSTTCDARFEWYVFTLQGFASERLRRSIARVCEKPAPGEAEEEAELEAEEEAEEEAEASSLVSEDDDASRRPPPRGTRRR